MSDYIKRKSIRNLYSCLNPNDRVLVGQVLIDIDAIPSAEVPTTMTGVIDAIHEAEYRGYMKGVEDRPKGEWASVLAELHERFDALEKELRRASAEMSAIIREHIDGQEDEPQTSCDTCKHKGEYAYCRLCGRLSENNYEPLTNCGADMREREGE